MALKDWRKSKTDDLWYYKPREKPTPTNPAKMVINAVKTNKGYDIYVAKGGINISPTKIKSVRTKREALKYMRSYMRKH